jgi:hypothetical protein
VIKRLAKGQLDEKVASLKHKILDITTRNSVKLHLTVLYDRVRDVEKSMAHHIPPNLKGSGKKILVDLHGYSSECEKKCCLLDLEHIKSLFFLKTCEIIKTFTVTHSFFNTQAN